MKLYQFIIFIIIFISICITFGFKLLNVVGISLQNAKIKNIPTIDVENFENKLLSPNYGSPDMHNYDRRSYPPATLNADTSMPDIRKVKPDKNQYPDADIPLGEELPDDKMIYLDSDKIYINPFYPEEKSLQKPNQNYPNPDEMSYVEKNAFKFGYPNGMTMQDYVNWLSLFRNSPDLLTLDHNINYQKLIKNIKIKFEEGRVPPPAKKLPPLNEHAYFINMYTSNPTQLDPLFTQSRDAEVRMASNLGDPHNGIMAFNYNDYTTFSQNFNVMGNTQNIYNPELAEKTDPYFLQKFTGPVSLIKEPNLTD